jgi:nucleoside-diphosphate-sugar epimerase
VGEKCVANNILLVGCGDIGINLGLMLAAKGERVWGLRRSSTLPNPLMTLNADVTDPDSLRCLSALALDYVVLTLTPASFSDEGYRSVFVDGLANVLAVLKTVSSIKRIFWVSSTSVYHQADGQWVDEESSTDPGSFSGRRLLQAEQLLAASGFVYSVIRFAGIYGPGRRRLIEQVIAGQGCEKLPPLYTNRIHREDCVGFLSHLIEQDQQGEKVERCYIGVDSEPVAMWQLKSWLAQQLGVDPNSLTSVEQTRRSSKRCSNQRLLSSGYQLLYPSYQQGYLALLADEK